MRLKKNIYILHRRNVGELIHMLSLSDAENFIHAFMTPKLDYCNVLLAGCPAGSINMLQLVEKAAARVLTKAMNGITISQK